MRYKRRQLTILLVAILALSASACGKKAIATTMHLLRTEGTVAVADGEGKEVAISENLGLYSGYEIETGQEAYAWIDLDKTKLAKMDADSAVEIHRDGSHLEMVVGKGSLFFNIEEHLTEEETLDIRTSGMTIGIRGTCGWVSAVDEGHLQAYILEGTVECSGAENAAGAVSVGAGEVAELSVKDGKAEILVRKFSVSEIPQFVQAELEENEDLNERVKGACGLDVRQWMQSTATVTMPVTSEEIQELFEKEGAVTVVVQPGGGDNVLAITNDLYVGSPEGASLLLGEGISVNIEEGSGLTVWEGRTLEVQGDVTVHGTLYNIGTTRIDGNLTIETTVWNEGNLTVAGGIVLLPDRLISDDGEGGTEWAVASLNNEGSLRADQGIRNEGSIYVSDDSELIGEVENVGEGRMEKMEGWE